MSEARDPTFYRSPSEAASAPPSDSPTSRRSTGQRSSPTP